MCGASVNPATMGGVGLGLQALSLLSNVGNQRSQYKAQAQQYRNMANAATSNANIARFNEQLTGRAGAHQQSQIRDRGRSALAGINVGAAANAVSGTSIDNIRGTSARNTAQDIYTSKMNTNYSMYGQEIEAQNYLNQADAYNKYANYYDDMASSSWFSTLLTGLPSLAQSYFNYRNTTTPNTYGKNKSPSMSLGDLSSGSFWDSMWF